MPDSVLTPGETSRDLLTQALRAALERNGPHVEAWLAAQDEAPRSAPAAVRPQCPDSPHRGPQGPNEDLAQCPTCLAPSWAMRPDGEVIGLHLDDCSLLNRHEGHCVGGGEGHPPADVVRGFWPGMADDIAAARARHTDPKETGTP